jgi:hypothetical protein
MASGGGCAGVIELCQVNFKKKWKISIANFDTENAETQQKLNENSIKLRQPQHLLGDEAQDQLGADRGCGTTVGHRWVTECKASRNGIW